MLYISQNKHDSAALIARGIAQTFDIEQITDAKAKIMGLRYYYEEKRLFREAEKMADILIYLALQKKEVFDKYLKKQGKKTKEGEKPPYTESRHERLYLSKIEDEAHLGDVLLDIKEKTEYPLVTLYQIYKYFNPSGKSSGEDEWYSPENVVECVHNLFDGPPDLDPATSLKANELIKAKKIYTKDNPGIDKVWKGKVFMNPPFGTKVITELTSHFLNNLKTITEGVVLTNSMTETIWAQKMLKNATSLCFPKGRLEFYNQKDEILKVMWGQILWYFGPNKVKFKKCFNHLGVCINLKL